MTPHDRASPPRNAVRAVLLLLCLGAPTSTVAQSTSTVLPGINLPGGDLRNFVADSAENCSRACLRNGSCQSWTWVKPGVQGTRGNCWLKESVPAQTTSDCCVSGVRTTAAVKGDSVSIKSVVGSGKAAEESQPNTTIGGVSQISTDSGKVQADRGPHLRVGGMAVTFARRVTGNHIASDPTRTFTERDRAIFLALQNESGSRLRADVNVYPDAVHGFDPSEPYWRGAWATMGPRQRHSLRLPGPEGGLIPGRYKAVVRVGGATRTATFTVDPEHPFATPADDQFVRGLGPNIALAALGAKVQASSSWNDEPSANRLIDGFNWIRDPGRDGQCINCGWATRKGDRRPTVTVDLAGDRPAEISTVIVDTRQFWPRGRSWEWVTGWLPKNVAVSVSQNGEPNTFERVATARLQRAFLKQAIELPEGTLAKSVRLEVLENVSGDAGAAFVELEVREAAEASPSIVEELDIDLAQPALGGALVRYTGYQGDWPGARLFDGIETSWVSYDRYFPQDFTLAFHQNRLAQIDRVELDLAQEAGRDTWPSEVAIAVSKDSPIDGFIEIARVPIEKRPGPHTISVNHAGRYLKIRILDNHGADVTTMAEISVFEDTDTGLSVLSSEAAREEAEPEDRDEKAYTVDASEAEPNNTLEDANDLEFAETLDGKIDPLGEEDVFRLPDLDPEASALSVAYSGRPYIRHGLSLLNAAGEVLSHFDPGDLPASDARLTFKLTGNESHLRLSEPPASVVVIWDTSGSMQGSEGDLERAVRQYIRLAPESQEIALVRFSDQVETLGGFSTDKSQLARRMNGKFDPDGGTSLYDSVLRGLRMLENRSGNRAIVLMTDGNDNSRTWLGEVWSELERNKVRLYTIGLGDGLQEYSYVLASTGERLLGHLAAGTNGRSFFATESSALRDFYSQIAKELTAPATYLLTPTQEIGEGLLELVATGDEIPSAAMPPVHLIFDVSGSMSERLPDGRPRIDAAKEAMYATLDGLPEGAPFGLTVYGARIPEQPDKARACTDIVTVQETGPLRKEEVRRFIRDLRPRGGTTPLASSIAHVFKQFGGRKGGIIIAITDGIEECDDEPVVTVERLAAASVDLELNLIGFDLRQEATREMMRRLAEAGRGRYYDAGDGAEVAAALRSAMAAPFLVRDAAGAEVARGTIGGGSVEVSPGSYEVAIQAADGPIRTRDVRIAADLTTTVSVNKVGSEVAIEVGEPRKFDPLAACGEPATRRGDDERVRRIQIRLTELGFAPGPADNMMGGNTGDAIAAFLAVHGLELSPVPSLLVEQHLDCVAEAGAAFAAAAE